jgi:hypothetical protein
MPCLATVPCRAWLAAALLAWIAWPASARAETSSCIVLDTLPQQIMTPGKYCLDHDFSQSFNAWAIDIYSNDVVLDCNGHRIRQTNAAGAFPGISNGIERSNVTVRNCVVDGFHDGISMSTNTAAGNRENVIENNTVVNFRQQGIVAWGSGVRIEGNHIANALGDDNGGMVGISLVSLDGNGAGNVIRNNTITDFRPGSNANANATQGIFLGNVRNTEISGNTISGLNSRTGQCTWAIYGSGATGTQVTGNVLLSVPQPVAAPLDGGQCAAVAMYGTVEQQATNVCSDNVASHFNTNYFGCVVNTNTSF